MPIVNDRKEFGYPVKHKRKVPFDPDIVIKRDFSKKNREIFRLDTELDRFILAFDDYRELVLDAFSSNIHYSTELEGNPLDLEEVERITRDSFERGSDLDEDYDKPTQEVVNHILTWMSTLFKGDWDLDTIRTVHGLIMNDFDEAKPGEFRTVRTSIQTDSGQEIFIPAPPEHIKEELQSLLKWVNKRSSAYSPVVSGAVLFHEFESIHPFLDGNGRVGRTLFHGYLHERGLTNSKLCLIEKEIVGDKEYYYDLLARTDYSGDYTELIDHFADSVLKSYRKAISAFQDRDLLTSDLDEISKRILTKARRKRGWFNLDDVRHWCQNESDYVLRKRIRHLVEINALSEKGRTRAKKYSYVDPIEEWISRLKLDGIPDL